MYMYIYIGRATSGIGSTRFIPRLGTVFSLFSPFFFPLFCPSRPTLVALFPFPWQTHTANTLAILMRCDHMRCRHRGVAKILSKSARGTKIFRKYFDGATRSAKNTKNVLRQFRSLIRVLVHLADTLKIRSNGGERERERGKESISERRGKIWRKEIPRTKFLAIVF